MLNANACSAVSTIGRCTAGQDSRCFVDFDSRSADQIITPPPGKSTDKFPEAINRRLHNPVVGFVFNKGGTVSPALAMKSCSQYGVLACV